MWAHDCSDGCRAKAQPRHLRAVVWRQALWYWPDWLRPDRWVLRSRTYAPACVDSRATVTATKQASDAVLREDATILSLHHA